MLIKLSRILIFICSRGFILYLGIFLLSRLMIDDNKVKEGVMVRTLNRLMPSYAYLVDIEENREKPDRAKLKKYLDYYEEIVEYYPNMADAHGLLGFCYYHSGEHQKAISSYEKAIEINSRFFWFHYNLGVIHFKNSRYAMAAEALENAAATNLEHALVFIRMSEMIYQPILLEAFQVSNRSGMDQLRAGYRDGHVLQVLSQYYLKNYEEVMRIARFVITSGLDHQEFFYYYAGLAAYELKEYQKAIALLELAVEKAPHHADTFRYLGLCLKALGRDKDAVKAVARFIILSKTKDPGILREDEIDLQAY